MRLQRARREEEEEVWGEEGGGDGDASSFSVRAVGRRLPSREGGGRIDSGLPRSFLAWDDVPAAEPASPAAQSTMTSPFAGLGGRGWGRLAIPRATCPGRYFPPLVGGGDMILLGDRDEQAYQWKYLLALGTKLCREGETGNDYQCNHFEYNHLK